MKIVIHNILNLKISYLFSFNLSVYEFSENVFCFYKRWLPNTNFDTDLNWNTGKMPCGNDQVIIPDDSPIIMLNSSATIGQLVSIKNYYHFFFFYHLRISSKHFFIQNNFLFL